MQLFERPECPLADAAVMIEVLERIVLPSADEGPVDKGLPLPADDAGMRHVNQLHSGCWVEFQTGPENSLRCKLAAIIEATGQYIFVNRTGMKVLERSRSSLAREFRQGRHGSSMTPYCLIGRWSRSSATCGASIAASDRVRTGYRGILGTHTVVVEGACMQLDPQAVGVRTCVFAPRPTSMRAPRAKFPCW